ncbi:hypothetical protein NL676_022598 [Syzygium grande]|nr:hypothetical protein NL676_022598 [Syzygium grande]
MGAPDNICVFLSWVRTSRHYNAEAAKELVRGTTTCVAAALVNRNGDRTRATENSFKLARFHPSAERSSTTLRGACGRVPTPPPISIDLDSSGVFSSRWSIFVAQEQTLVLSNFLASEERDDTLA